MNWEMIAVDEAAALQSMISSPFFQERLIRMTRTLEQYLLARYPNSNLASRWINYFTTTYTRGYSTLASLVIRQQVEMIAALEQREQDLLRILSRANNLGRRDVGGSNSWNVTGIIPEAVYPGNFTLGEISLNMDTSTVIRFDPYNSSNSAP